MNRVIKSFQKFSDALQEEIYECYQDGDLRRANFPFNGEITEGVIFEHEDSETLFLIPIQSIKTSKLSMASDDDDDDDDDDLKGGDDNDNEIDDEE